MLLCLLLSSWLWLLLWLSSLSFSFSFSLSWLLLLLVPPPPPHTFTMQSNTPQTNTDTQTDTDAQTDRQTHTYGRIGLFSSHPSRKHCCESVGSRSCKKGPRCRGRPMARNCSLARYWPEAHGPNPEYVAAYHVQRRASALGRTDTSIGEAAAEESVFSVRLESSASIGIPQVSAAELPSAQHQVYPRINPGTTKVQKFISG